MTATRNRIKTINKKIDDLEVIDKHFQESKIELDKARRSYEKLELSLNSEFKDIEKLERISIKGVFHSIVGDKKEQLEKAREEYYQVAMLHKKAKTNIETLEYELSILQKKADLLDQFEAELKGLHRLREDELMNEHSEYGIQLREVVREVKSILTYKDQVNRIKENGEWTLKKLTKTVLSLQEAKNWGEWDMMQKHRMSDYKKHGAIKDAKRSAFEAKKALYLFGKEVGELGLHLNTKNLDLDSMSSFLDVFFDNFLTDWLFQQKIKNILKSLNFIIEDVKDMISQVENKWDIADQKLSDLLYSKQNILNS